MASVAEHIKQLLFEHDCVVVPEFGGFLAPFHPAGVYGGGMLMPAHKRLVFNEVLQFDDGLLISHIARHEARSREEALLKIRSFTLHVRNELRHRKSYVLDGMGLFTLNDEDKLQFQPDASLNFFGESFGMAAFEPLYVRGRAVAAPAAPPLPPVVALPAAEAVVVRKLRPWWQQSGIAAGLAGALLLSVAGLVPEAPGHQASLDIRAVLPVKTARPARAVAPTAAPAVSGRPLPADTARRPVVAGPKANVLPLALRDAEINALGRRYLIVVGEYLNPRRAYRFASARPDAWRVVQPVGKRSYIVTAATLHESQATAQQQLQTLKSQFSHPLWILQTQP